MGLKSVFYLSVILCSDETFSFETFLSFDIALFMHFLWTWRLYSLKRIYNLNSPMEIMKLLLLCLSPPLIPYLANGVQKKWQAGLINRNNALKSRCCRINVFALKFWRRFHREHVTRTCLVCRTAVWPCDLQFGHDV